MPSACVTSLLGRLLAPLLLVALLAAGPLRAQPAAEPTPDQVKSLLQLLADPVVKTWIAREIHSPAGRGRPRRARATRVGRDRGRHLLRGRSGRPEGAAARRWPRQFPTCRSELVAAEARLFADLEATGWLRVLLLLAAFVGLGYGCERVFWLATAAFRERIMASPLDTPAARGRAVLARLVYGLALVLTFAAGQHRRVPRLVLAGRACAPLVLGYLLAFLALRVAMVLARFLFAPQNPALSRGADGRRRGLGSGTARRWPSSAGTRSATSPSSCCAASASASPRS